MSKIKMEHASKCWGKNLIFLLIIRNKLIVVILLNMSLGQNF